MTWTQDFQTARAGAATLSEIPDYGGLVKLAETVGKNLHTDGVSSRQIRVLLSETTAGVSRIRRGRTLGLAGQPSRQDDAARREAALLNISLVYNAGREKSGTEGVKKLTELIGAMTDHVKSFEDFKVLRKFSEAIIAYFKFAEEQSKANRGGRR